VHLYVLKNFELGLEMPLMYNFDEVAKHFSPKFVGGVGLVDYCSNIVSELIYQLRQGVGG